MLITKVIPSSNKDGIEKQIDLPKPVGKRPIVSLPSKIESIINPCSGFKLEKPK